MDEIVNQAAKNRFMFGGQGRIDGFEGDEPASLDEVSQEAAGEEGVPVGRERGVDLAEESSVTPVDEAARVAI